MTKVALRLLVTYVSCNQEKKVTTTKGINVYLFSYAALLSSPVLVPLL
jgi:hypothetical protein